VHTIKYNKSFYCYLNFSLNFIVDGRFTAWSNWGTCDKACGVGNQTRTRSCTDPAPANNGADCVGLEEDIQLCKIIDCKGTP